MAKINYPAGLKITDFNMSILYPGKIEHALVSGTPNTLVRGRPRWQGVVTWGQAYDNQVLERLLAELDVSENYTELPFHRKTVGGYGLRAPSEASFTTGVFLLVHANTVKASDIPVGSYIKVGDTMSSIDKVSANTSTTTSVSIFPIPSVDSFVEASGVYNTTLGDPSVIRARMRTGSNSPVIASSALPTDVNNTGLFAPVNWAWEEYTA